MVGVIFVDCSALIASGEAIGDEAQSEHDRRRHQQYANQRQDAPTRNHPIDLRNRRADEELREDTKTRRRPHTRGNQCHGA